MITLRSLLFFFFFSSLSALTGLLFMPWSIISRKRSILAPTVVFAFLAEYCLKWICGVRFEIEGKEHIPNEPFLIVANHQSVLETMMFHRIFRYPVMIFKKNLLKVPLLGFFLRRSGMIPVDRENATSGFKAMLKNVDIALFEEKRPICVFPEGTRRPVGSLGAFKRGIELIASKTNVPILGVVHNAGECWPYNSWKISPGVVRFVILPLKRFDKEDMIKQIENYIKEGLKKVG